MLKANGFDDCIIGVGSSFNRKDVLVYCLDKMRSKLMDGDMTSEEADEYISYNILGCYSGEGMPIFVEKIELYNEIFAPKS